MTTKATAATIEIVEKTKNPQGPDDYGVIVPNEIRINGTPLLAAGDHPIVIHEMNIGGDPTAVYVTLTLFARRVTISEEAQAAA